ncbi:MAG: ATP-binding cassette domain-containing protein [Candidatus Omnitrophica bacterium]|nr:ATP-binding cassette domain-containing protein [Candidatus Omnitrophota bacterium]
MFRDILLNVKYRINDLRPLMGDVKVIFLYSSRLLAKYKKDLMKISLLKGLTFPIGIAGIYMTKNVLDKGIFAGDFRVFLFLTVLVLLAYTLLHALSYVVEKFTAKVRTAFSVDVNRDLARRLFGMNYLEIRKMTSSENAFFLGYDYGNIEALMFGEIPSLISVLKIPVIFVLSAVMSLPLTLLVLLAVPSLVVHLLWAAKRREVYRTEEIEKVRRYNSSLHDLFLNLKLIKSSGKEDWALSRVMSFFRDKVRFSMKTDLLSRKAHYIGSVFMRVNTSVFWIFGGYLIIRGSLTFGSFSAVLMYMAVLLGEMEKVSNAVQSLNEEKVSIARCSSFIKEMCIAGKERQKVFDEGMFEKGLEFREVSFGYEAGKPVLEGVSLFIPPAGWSLIKGASGIGKTTLLSLIVRLFEPWKGEILAGGTDVARIDKDVFYRNVSIVQQESYILNDTLARNIFLGNSFDDREMEKVLMCAGLSGFAEELPEGYDTMLEESGADLSGGQRQRISIARALAGGPKVLVLDEATSFVDPGKEEEIFGKIRTSFPDIQVIFVTHRETARKYADHVFVMENGAVLSEKENVQI